MSVDDIKKLMLLEAEAGVGSDLSQSTAGPPCLPQPQALLQCISSLLSLYHGRDLFRLHCRGGCHSATAPWWGVLQSWGPSPVPSPFPLPASHWLETSPLQMCFWSIPASKPTHPPFRVASKPELSNTQFLTPCCQLSLTLSSFKGKTFLMPNKPGTAGSDVWVRNRSFLQLTA